MQVHPHFSFERDGAQVVKAMLESRFATNPTMPIFLLYIQNTKTEFSLSIELFPLPKIFPLSNQHEMK